MVTAGSSREILASAAICLQDTIRNCVRFLQSPRIEVDGQAELVFHDPVFDVPDRPGTQDLHHPALSSLVPARRHR